MSGSKELTDFPPSTTTISTVAVQAGRSKVVLAVLRSAEWIRVRVHQMEPDLMDVGATLEEALQLQREHDELLARLKSKEGEVAQLLRSADTYTDTNRSQADVHSAMADTMAEAWRDLNEKLQYRSKLLEQSITFHQSAKDLQSNMEKVQGNFTGAPLASDVDSARRLLQQHMDMKQTILESSKYTLDLGQSLLDQIKEMGMHADIQNRHATTAACYGIEHLLELLHDRRRHLEDLWTQRKIQLEQCLQLCQLDQEVNKTLEWFRTSGTNYLQRTELGTSYSGAKYIQEQHSQFEAEAREIQERMLRLLRTADGLLRRASVDAEGIRSRLMLVDQECENFMVKLDSRRKNIFMAVSFFNLAETALNQLDQIEVQLNSMDLPRNSAELAERHSQLSNAIVEASTEAVHEGRLLLERVSSVDPGADGVRRKLDELNQRCAHLETLCKARRAEAWQRSQAFLQFQESYNSLSTWLSQIGQSTLTRHSSMGSSLASAKDFLEVHEQLDEDIRDKNAELEALSAAAMALVKSGDQEAKSAAERADALTKQYARLQRVVETRIQLALIYVSFLKQKQQLSSSLDGLQHIVRSETEDLQDITDTALQQVQSMYTQSEQLFAEFSSKGKLFLQNSSTINDDSSLEVRTAINTVESSLDEAGQRMTALTQQWEAWKQHVMTSKQFKSQWHQFIGDARRTIDHVMKIEREFFLPHIAGNLGNSLEKAQELQIKLTEFSPIAKQAQEEIEERLKTAELLSLKGDTRGQKEQIVNELIRVHQRFQSRMNEYQLLIRMTIEFFKNVSQLDELIERTERQYMQSQLPTDLSQAESMLQQHKREKTEISQLINFTSEEGENIVTRVRQQDAEAEAREDVQDVLELMTDYRRRWESTWDEQERRLRQNLQICQFNYDLRQIHSEIDELHSHLQARRGSYGNSLPAAKMTVQAFNQFEKTVELIEKKIKDFISTAELMVQDEHYDSANIRREIDVLKNKWSTFHTSVRDYRSQLDSSILYFTFIEECEMWMREGSQLLINIGRRAPECRKPEEAAELIQKLERHVEQGKPLQEKRLQKISELSLQLYGEQGASKVRPLVIQYQDIMQSFEQADNELTLLRDNLQGKGRQPVEETMDQSKAAAAAAPRMGPKPPRITQHLKNAEVMEGVKFTFECRVESDTVPEVRWFKDNLPLTSPDYETRYDKGLATLTIEETFSEDTARYTCKVTNPAGMAESSAYLTVKETHQQIVPPEFTKNIKSVDVAEGTPLALECHVVGIPSPTVSWFKDEVNIDNSPEYIITKINGSCCLKVRQALPGHSARYTCRAVNPGGEAASSARIAVIPVRAPVFQQPLQDVTAPEGKSVHLEVRFTGSPAPDVAWFRGTNRVLNSNMYKVTIESNFSSLDIREAYAEDSDTYTVVIKNMVAEARSSCKLTIESIFSSPLEGMSQISTDVERVQPVATRPMFTSLLSPTKEVPEGTRVRLDCVLVGRPEPEVIWLKNEKPVKESSDIQLLFEGDRCTLVVREAVASDSGFYKVIARNPHGVAESACKLHVEPVSEMSDASVGEYTAPKFTQPLKDLQVKSGQRVCLQCRVAGHPLPEVQWFMDNKQLESSPDFQITAFADVHSLTIPEVFEEDSGSYMVRAVNRAGQSTCLARLTVTPAPEEEEMERSQAPRREHIPQQPPEFGKLFQDKTAKPGDSVTFECIISGSPKPKVTWQFNGEPLVSQDYQVTMEGDKYRLTIPEVFDEDAGRFSVTAENPSGKATCSAQLVVAPPLPSQPPPGPVVRPARTVSIDLPDTIVAAAAPPVSVQATRVVQTVPVPGGVFEREMVHTVTTTEKRVSRTFTTSEDEYMSGRESHSETLLTEVKPKKKAKMMTEKYSSSVTADLPPKFQPVDLTIEVPVPPKFVQALKSITALEGTRVTFEGVVTGKPEPTIRWFRENKEITDRPDFEISYRGGRVSMSIPETFEDDQGQYTCAAENKGGLASSTAELIIRASMTPPAFAEELKPQYRREGETVKLTVKVSGQPPPTVMWYREGRRLVSSPDFEIRQEGDIHSLYIPEVFYEDSGKFAVRATNPAGEAISAANLMVEPTAEEAPTLLRAPERRPVYGSVTPERAAPPAAKQPKLQDSDERYRAELQMQVEGETELAPFEKRIALFGAGPPQEPRVSPQKRPPSQSPLMPRKPIDTGKERPWFNKNLPNQTPTKQGQKVILEVIIDGRPEPIVKWYREDVEIVNSPDYILSQTDKTYRLTIVEAFPEDSGKFRVVATNAEGSVASETNLRVEGAPVPMEIQRQQPRFEERLQLQPEAPKPPELAPVEMRVPVYQPPPPAPAEESMVFPQKRAPSKSPVMPRKQVPPQPSEPVMVAQKRKPTFEKPLPTQTTTRQGNRLTLEVIIDAHPEPIVKWYREEIEITNSPDYILSQAENTYTLTIVEAFPEDSGRFKVLATNAEGSVASQTNLMVEGVPEPVAREPPPPPPKPVQEPSVAPMQRPPAQSPLFPRKQEPQQVPPPPPTQPVSEPMVAPKQHTPAQSPLFPRKEMPPQAPPPAPAPAPVVAPKPRTPSQSPLMPRKVAPPPQEPAYVAVKKRPVFEQPLPQQMPVRQGDTVVLEIVIEAHPEPIVKWYREEMEITSSPDYIISQTENTYRLTITETFPEDSGRFKVIAANAEGSVTSETYLRVEGAPEPMETDERFSETMELQVDRRPQQLPMFEATIPITRAPQPQAPAPPPPPPVVSDRQKPTFTQPLKNVRAKEGDRVTLTVRIEGRPEPVVKWYREGILIEHSPDYHISHFDKTFTLIIAEVFPEDSGVFKCVAMNADGTTTTESRLEVEPRPIPLEKFTPEKAPKPEYAPPLPSAPPPTAPAPPPAHIPPSFVQKMQDVRLVEGTNIKLECRVLGKPFPQIDFTHYSQPVFEGPRHRITVDERTGRCTLLISNARPEDAGQYMCTASNPAGQDSTTATILPEAPRMREAEEPELSAVRRLIQEEEQRPRRPADDGRLSDSEFVVSSFEQRLMREIEYREGKVRLHSETETEYDTDQPEEKVAPTHAYAPEIQQPLKDFRLMEGSDATFVCKVTGRPRPKIAWYKDGRRIKRSSRYDIKYTQDGYSTLRIHMALPEDAGHYTMLAVNSVGKTTCSSELYIDRVGNIDATSFVAPETLDRIMRRDSVRGERGPEEQGGIFETNTKPQFKRIPADLEVREGNPVRLDCVLSGRPIPELFWYRNETQVNNDDNHKIVVNEDGIHSLLIMSATRQDTGVYTCIARNKAGEDTFTVTLTILEREQMAPPRFVERMKNYTIVEGQSVSLTCHAEGVPTPMMSWQKDNKMLTPGKEYKVETVGGRSTLHVSCASMSDSAWFQCSAVNVAGTATTRSKLVVQPDLSRFQLQEEPVKKAVQPKREAPPAPRAAAPQPERVLSPKEPVQRAPISEQPFAADTRPFVHPSEVSKIAIHLADATGREGFDYESAVQEYIRREGEAPPPEDLYDKTKNRPPKFKTQIKDLLTLKENDPVHFECKLIPLGDPTMKVEWFKDGEPLHYGTRFMPAYDFGFVSLDIHWVNSEDSGVYTCRATNNYGEDTSSATVVCRASESIIMETQLPGDGADRLIEMEEHWRSQMVLDERHIEEPQTRTPPVFDLKPEPFETGEGEPAKFLVKVGGYPRPRVSWWINGSLIVSSTRFKLTYDGMMHHMEIPRVREYDAGQIRVVAKNPEGEAECSTSLVVLPREDWRARLRQAPRADMEIELERRRKVELRSVELEKALKKPKATEFELRQLERGVVTRVKETRDEEVVTTERQYISVHSQLRHTEPSLAAQPVYVKQVTLDTAKPTEDTSKVAEQQITLERGQPPVFTKPLRPVRVPEGSGVTLEVHYTGSPPPIISWYRDNFEIQPSRDFQISTTATTSTLHIPEVFLEDSGMFSVKAYNKFGQVQCKAKLTVVEAEAPERETSPEFHNLMRDNCATQGEPATFDCQVVGNPPPKVHWEKDGVQLRDSPRWKFIDEAENHTLVIYEVRPDDAGQYACVAINSVGKSTCTARLDVEIPTQPMEFQPQLSELESKVQAPRVVEEPRTMEVEEGEPVKFTCVITGKPPPVVTWYRNNQLVKPSKYFQMSSTTEGLHTLSIMEAFPEDTGTYKCVARNKAGEVACITFLKVHGVESEPEPVQLMAQAQPPSFIRPVANTMVPEGTPAKLDAVYSGHPTPEITWIRNGIQTLHDSRDLKIETTDSMTTLTIFSALPEDMGLITCRAKNQAGIAECSAELYVQREEEVQKLAQQLHVTVAQRAPPEFVRPLQPVQEVEIGQTARMEAEMTSVPITSYTWYINGIEIQPTERTRILHEGKTIVLIIVNAGPRDTGEYMLRVQNELGEVTCKTTLIIKGAEKLIEIPDTEMTEMTVTRTVTTIQREEQVVTQMVKPQVVTPLEPEIFVRERGIARLECQIQSHPPPLVTWFVNGMEIKPSPHYEIRFEEGKSTLLIIEVGPQDTGEYTCRAVSELGEAVSSTTLYVQEPLEEEMPGVKDTSLTVEPSPTMEAMVPPRFLEPLETKQAIDGQEIKMTCRVSGAPMPTISFFHDSKNIDEDEEFVITYDSETGEICLIIVEVFPEDQGQYICIAENPAGQATTSAYLSIMESEETTLELEPQTQETTQVPEGEDVTITLDMPLAPEPMETEEKPIQEEVILVSEAPAEEVKPAVVEKPKPEPIFKEELMAESPIFESPIPESLTGTETSDSYYTAQEEVDEETVEPRVIERPKLVALVPDKIPESPEREIIPLDVDMEEEIPESVTPTEEVAEEPIAKVTQDRDRKLPEFPEEKKPEEAPVLMQEVTVEEVSKETDEVTFVIPVDEEETEVKTVIPDTPVEEEKPITRAKTPPQESAQEEVFEAVFELVEEQPQILPTQAPDEIPPEFVELLQPQVVVEGESVTMTCKLIGSPAPSVTWYRNSIVIESGPDIKVTYDIPTGVCILEIAEVFPEDAGEVVCRAVNPFGEAMTSANLLVQVVEETETVTTSETTVTETVTTTTRVTETLDTEEMPEVRLVDEQHTTTMEIAPNFTKTLLPTTEVEEGGTVRLEVQLDSQPEAEVKWFVNEVQIEPTQRTRIETDRSTNVLVIVDVTPEDSGEYICQAENIHGTVTCKTTLIVTPIHRTEVVIEREDVEKDQEMRPVEEAPTEAAEAPKPEEAPEAPTEVPQAEEPIAPMFTTLLQPMVVEDGQRVTMTVRFIGRPSPQITWYQNGTPLKPSSDFEIFVDHDKGESTLIIVEVFPDDDGEYTCIALNEVGESITTCRLTVITTEEDVEVESDEHHKETIEIDIGKQKPETTEVVPADGRTTVKEVVTHQVEAGAPATFEIQFGLQKATTSATSIVQQTTTYTQVSRELREEEITDVTEGPSTTQTSVMMTKAEETQPIELRVSVPKEGQVVEQLSEATRVVTSEVRQIPVEERPSEERHSETIEIQHEGKPQVQEVLFQVPVTKTETIEVHTEEHRRQSAQRIEIEIHETQLQRQPQPQELDIPIGKVTKAEMEIDVVDTAATEAPRPSEETVEETRQTLVKETKTIQFEVQQPQQVFEEAQIEVSLVPEESTADVEETEVKAPVEETILTEREVIEKADVVPSEVQFEVELVPEEKPSEEAPATFEETITIDTQAVETEQPAAVLMEESKVEDVVEVQAPEETLEVEEVEVSAPVEEVIETQREVIEKMEEVPTEVQMEVELVPEEKPEDQEAVTFQETITIDTQSVEAEAPVAAPTEESIVESVEEVLTVETTTEVTKAEAQAPTEEVFVSEREIISKAEEIPSEVQMEIDLVPEEKPEEQEAQTFEETITIDTQPVQLETQVSAPEEETQVEIREIIETPDTTETFVTETEVSQVQEVPFEEVTLDIKLDAEGVEPEVTTTQVEQVIVSEAEEVKETHKEEIELQIAGKEPQSEEIQFTLQVQPEVAEVEIPVSEEVSIETATFKSEMEVTKTEDVEVEETHREELTFQIEGKQQELEEVQFNLQVEEKEQPEETPVTEVAAPSVEQVLEVPETVEGKAPEFTWGLMSLKVMDGEEVKFRCEVTGNPMPDISWFHDDKPIAENQDFSISYDLESGACTLLIAEVFPQDAGEYRCVAVNIHGEAVTRAYLEVESYEYVPDSEEASESMMSSIDPSSPKPTPADSDTEVPTHSREFVEEIQRLQEQISTELTEHEEDVPKEEPAPEYIAQAEAEEQPEEEAVIVISDVPSEEAAQTQVPAEAAQVSAEETHFQAEPVQEVSEVPQVIEVVSEDQEAAVPTEVTTELSKSTLQPEAQFQVEVVQETEDQPEVSEVTLETATAAAEEEVVIDISATTEETVAQYQADVVEESVEQPEVSDVVTGIPDEAQTTEIPMELITTSQETPSEFKAEAVEEITETPEVSLVTEETTEEAVPSEITVELVGAEQEQPSEYKADTVEEVTVQPEVTEVTEEPAEEVVPSEISVELVGAEKEQPSEYKAETLEEVTVQPEITEVTEETTEEAVPSEITVELVGAEKEQPLEYKADTLEDVTEQPEVTEVTEETTEEAVPSEVTVELVGAEKEQPSEYKAETLEEVTEQPEVTEVTEETAEEAVPSEITVELVGAEKEQPSEYKADTLEEVTEQPEVTEVTEETTEEAVPSEITVELVGAEKEQPSEYKAETLEEVTVQPEITEVTEEPTEEAVPSEVSMELVGAELEQPSEYKAETVEEVTEQPSVIEVTEEPTEEVTPSEVSVEMAGLEAEKPSEYQTETVLEITEQTDVTEVQEETPQEVVPSEITVDLAETEKEQPQEYKAEAVEETVQPVEITGVEEEVLEEAETGVITVDLAEPMEEKPSEYKTESVEEVTEEAQVAPVTEQVTEEALEAEIPQETVESVTEQTSEYQIEVVTETVEQPEVVPVQEEVTEEAQPSDISVETAEAEKVQPSEYKTEIVTEVTEQPEISEVTEEQTEEAGIIQIDIEQVETAVEKPAEFKTEVVEEVTEQPEVSSVEEQPTEEVLTVEIPAELTETAQEQPLESIVDVVMEEAVQPEVEHVEEETPEAAAQAEEPTEVTTATELKPSEYQTEVLEEVVEQPQVAEVPSEEVEEAVPTDMPIQIEEIVTESTEQFKTEAVEETVTQPEVEAISEEGAIEAGVIEITTELAETAEEKPAEFETKPIEEEIPEATVSEGVEPETAIKPESEEVTVDITEAVTKQPEEFQTKETEEVVVVSDVEEQPEEAVSKAVQEEIEQFATEFVEKIFTDVQQLQAEEEPIAPEKVPIEEQEVPEEEKPAEEQPEEQPEETLDTYVTGLVHEIMEEAETKVVTTVSTTEKVELEIPATQKIVKEEIQIELPAKPEEEEEELEAPSFTVMLSDITVMEGTMMRLEVVATGRPMPELTWHLDDQPITMSEEITVVTEKGHSVLTIQEVLPDDEGEYRVEAVNKVGRCTSVAYITVLLPEQKEVVTEDVEISETFISEQEIVEETTQVDVEIELKPTEGPKEEESEVVQPEEKIPAAPAETGAPEAPRFTQTLQRQLDVFEGTSVTLICIVVGQPRPTVTWYREEIELAPSERFITEYHEDGRCVLTIKDITFDDEAEYTCQAKNEAGVCTTFVDIFVEKFLNAEERLVREEFYRIEVEIEIQWPKKRSKEESSSDSNQDKLSKADDT